MGANLQAWDPAATTQNGPLTPKVVKAAEGVWEAARATGVEPYFRYALPKHPEIQKMIAALSAAKKA